MSQRNASRMVMLDVCRGAAALTIVLHHTCKTVIKQDVGRLWAAGGLTNKLGAIIQALLWVPDRLNHEAVLFFFVLSGFCIHYRAAQNMAQGRRPPINTGRFYSKRLLRLLPPLLVALVLTYLCDAWSGRLLQSTGMDIRNGYLAPAANGDYRNLPVMFGNLALLMPFFVAPYGTNGPLWALGYEAWYYVLYPFWLWTSKRFGGLAAFGAAILVAGLSVVFVHGRQFPLYPVMSTWWVWCLGAFLAEIRVGRYQGAAMIDAIPVWFAVPAGAFLLVAFTLRPPPHSLVMYTAWSPLMGFIIFKFAEETPSMSSRVFGLLSTVGLFSYSLYIVQMPILVLLSALWLVYFGQVPRLPWLLVPAVLCTLIAGWGLATFVEHPVERARARLASASRLKTSIG